MTRSNEKPFGQQGFWLSSAVSRRQIFAGAGGIAAAMALASCSPNTSTTSSTTSSGVPKRGGNFRLGMTGGGSKDMLDGQSLITPIDGARLTSAFETLVTFDNAGRVTTDGLAESIEADGPDQYTIRLHKDIEFHNGKTLTAEDVIYSLQRVGSDVALAGHAASAPMDLANLKQLDKYTVRLPMKTPDATILEALANYYFSIVPTGYKAFSGDVSTQIGTGPYILKSFTPGEQSVSERNPNYRREGQPYFDSVTIINYSDSTAEVNALQGGQIDAMTDLPAGQVAALEGQGLGVLKSQTGTWMPLCMRVDVAPFDDNRVRQAFRLIPDRSAMLKQVASGYGEIGNDLYGRYDPSYNKDLPQREQDLEKAKALLREAGHENLTVDLYTTNAGSGMVELATVFAAQAKLAGVTVNVKNVPSSTYYAEDYLTYPFSMDWWNPRGYLRQVVQGSLPTSISNETHWPPASGEGSDFVNLFNKAMATPDDAARTKIVHQMQQLEYDLGGYIIPYFPAKLDAYASHVRGLSPAQTVFPLNNFGNGFRTIWFD